MRRRSATLLQVLTVSVAVVALVLLLWEPHLEGRNAQASLREIYLGDPFLAFVYVGSIPFFVAAYQAFRLLGRVRSHGTGSPEGNDRSARLVRDCCVATIGFIVVGVGLLLLVGEERPPAVVMGVLATIPVLVVGVPAIAYGRVERSTVG